MSERLSLPSLMVPVRGDMGLSIRSAKTGKLLRRIDIRNTITYVGLSNLCHLLTQRADDYLPAAFRITRLRVGEGNTPAAANQTQLADSSSLHYAAELAIGDANMIMSLAPPGPFEIRFMATLDAATANGKNLQEAGLFTQGDAAPASPLAILLPQMFSRQTHPTVPKTSALVIDYDWRIAFTA